MPFISNGLTYSTLSLALSSLPATFSSDQIITCTEDTGLTSSNGLVIPTKNINGYRLVIQGDVSTRQISNNSSGSYVIQCGINNLTLKNLQIVSTNYSLTNQRSLYITSGINGLVLDTVVFNGGYYAIGMAGLTGSNQVTNPTITNCEFKNVTAGSILLGSGTFTTGDFTQPSSSYQITGLSLTGNTFHDVNSGTAIPGTTSSYTNVGVYLYKVYGATISDNKTDTTSDYGYHLQHCQSIVYTRNMIRKSANLNLSTRSAFRFFNSWILDINNNLIYENDITNLQNEINTCNSIKINNNTVVSNTGTPLSVATSTIIQQHCNNIYYSGNGHMKMDNSTAGLTHSNQLLACDYNFYHSGSDTFSCEYQFGSTIYRPRATLYTDTLTWQNLGFDNHSYFACTSSTTSENADIFNRLTNVLKPYYSTLITSNAYQKGSTAFGGTSDVRNFTKRGLYDIGAYDYDAIDPNAPPPPSLVILGDRSSGIVNASTFSFTSTAIANSPSTISSYYWDFGDGATSSQQNPTHIFSATGSIVTTCTVTDSNSYQTLQSLVLTIYSDGIEIFGGFRDKVIYTGSSALQNAITNSFRLNVGDTSDSTLISDVTVLVRTTATQSLLYFNNKPAGNYYFTVTTDMSFTNGVKCKVNNNGSPGNGMSLENGSNAIFKNIIFTGGNPAAVRLGPTFTKNIRFEDCEFRKSQYCMYMQSCDSISFYRCLFNGASYYKLDMESSTNMTFVSCIFDYDSYPATEPSLYPSQQCNIAVVDNATFEGCTFSGHGNWVEFIKGYGLSNWTFNRCNFQKYLGHIMWLTGGPGTYYNGTGIKFNSCVFDHAMYLNPSQNTIDFGTGSVVASQAMFELNYCFDIQFNNNTIIQDRAGNNLQLYWTYTSNGCSNLKFFNNIFYFKNSGTSSITNEYRVYRIEANTIPSGYLEIYTSNNYYAFEQISNLYLRWGSLGATSYGDISSVKLIPGYNLEIGSSQSRASLLSGIINETTYEPLTSSPVLNMTSNILFEYDYDGNKHLSPGAAGAKEYTKIGFTSSNSNFKIYNKNPKLSSSIIYDNSVNNVTIPSLDKLDVTNDYPSFIKSYEWIITSSTGSILSRCKNPKFNYTFQNQGTYSISLSTVYNDNSTYSISIPNYFSISIPRPVANFILSDYLIFPSDTVDFTNQSLYATSYQWVISNTSTGSSQSFTSSNISQLQFNNPGTYSVSLTSINSIDTDTKSYSQTLQVVPNLNVPYIDMNVSRNVWFQNETIYIDSDIRFSHIADNVKWFFYNSDTYTQSHVSYQKNPTMNGSSFPVGDYDVLLLVTNPLGDVKKFKRRFISVFPTPVSIISVTCSLTDTNIDVSSGFVKDGTRIDGTASNILPGTLIKLTGVTKKVYLTNIHGTQNLPVMVVSDNPGGLFEIKMSGSATNGIHLYGCSHVAVLGQYNRGNLPYGFSIYNDPDPNVVASGVFGVKAEGLSTYVRFNGIETYNTSFAGIQCKTEPDPTNNLTWRGSGFQMDYTRIHDCYIHDTGGEGMYLGFTEYDAANSYYGPPTVKDVNGNTVSYYFAHRMVNTKVWRNTIYRSGWDGIQVGNSDFGCEIHDNYLSQTGFFNVFGQNAGMSLNTGCSIEVYNNISDNTINCSVFDIGYFYNNVINSSNIYDGFYIFADYVPYWNYNLPVTTAPYAGQWDGTTYYNNSLTKIKIFNNTVYTNRHLATYNNRMPAKNDPFLFSVRQNNVIYTQFAYSNFDPTKAPLPVTGQEQAKLIRLQYIDGTSVIGKSSMNFTNNVARRKDNISDLKMINIEKMQFEIVPTSSLLNSSDITSYASEITFNKFQGEYYDINGFKRDNVNTTLQTIGAYTFNSSYISNGYTQSLTVLLRGGTAGDYNTFTGSQSEITVNMTTNQLVVHDGITVGGHPTVIGASGTFSIGSNIYIVVNGLIKNII